MVETVELAALAEALALVEVLVLEGASALGLEVALVLDQVVALEQAREARLGNWYLMSTWSSNLRCRALQFHQVGSCRRLKHLPIYSSSMSVLLMHADTLE